MIGRGCRYFNNSDACAYVHAVLTKYGSQIDHRHVLMLQIVQLSDVLCLS